MPLQLEGGASLRACSRSERLLERKHGFESKYVFVSPIPGVCLLQQLLLCAAGMGLDQGLDVTLYVR